MRSVKEQVDMANLAVDPNQMLTTHQAAALLGLQACTLAAWREDGSQPGLAFFKLGKAVRYRYGDLIAFLETRRASSTLVARQLARSTPPSPCRDAHEGPARRKARKPSSSSAGQQSLF
jgi:hypothetical protein